MPPIPSEPEKNSNGKDIPSMQQLLDDPFLLLFIGVTMPTVIYLIWGIMEVASVPLGK